MERLPDLWRAWVAGMLSDETAGLLENLDRLRCWISNGLARNEECAAFYINTTHQAISALKAYSESRDSDGSGEADETGTGSAVGDSAGRETASPTPSSEPHHDQP